MGSRSVSSTAFTSYGISRQRNGFLNIEGPGTLTSEEVVPDGAGLFSILKEDLTNNWIMYNGDPVSGNEYRYSNDYNGLGVGSIIQKQFFEEISMNLPAYQIQVSDSTAPYQGLANFTQMPTLATQIVDSSSDCKQHVMLFQTTADSLPNNGSVSRGIDQNYRIRFEFDLRERLFWFPPTNVGDREFADELYQLNLRLRNL